MVYFGRINHSETFSFLFVIFPAFSTPSLFIKSHNSKCNLQNRLYFQEKQSFYHQQCFITPLKTTHTQFSHQHLTYFTIEQSLDLKQQFAMGCYDWWSDITFSVLYFINKPLGFCQGEGWCCNWPPKLVSLWTYRIPGSSCIVMVTIPFETNSLNFRVTLLKLRSCLHSGELCYLGKF